MEEKRCTSFGFDSFRFGGLGSDRFASNSCDLGLTIRFVKTVE